MVLLLFSFAFLLAYALLISYYYRGWKKTADFHPTYAIPQAFISVIVPARNEEQHIPTLLNALNAQSFSKDHFEVIVVDDFSTDNTAEVVRQHILSNARLIRPSVDAATSSKKKAIEAGIQIARGEMILTTDADCQPDTLWLQTIHDFYVQTNASFIAAPVKFSYHSSALQIFQALDFLVLQGITAASVATDFHTMCNGANLAYKKISFQKVNGFEGIDKVATGDDMLLMHKIRELDAAGVHYLKSKSAIVNTQPMHSWKNFFMQRKRWASKTLVYDDKRIVAVLAFVYLFNCLFWILVIASFFKPLYWWYVLSFWVIKTIIELPFVSSVAKFYDEQKLMKYFFFFQPVHMFYTVFVGFFSQFGKYEWKGRITR
jgi:glycosyltransferase involved in cell wall biosynthesis